jgi:hypothetical protein
MTFFVLLLGIAIMTWAGLLLIRRRRKQNLEFLAKASGFTSHSQLAGAIALVRRAGINPSQARPHYQFLVDAFGAPAVEAAASMLVGGTFDHRFRGQALEAALDQLSQEHPDPVIDAIVEDALKEGPPSPSPAPPLKPPTPGPHGDGLPF